MSKTFTFPVLILSLASAMALAAQTRPGAALQALQRAQRAAGGADRLLAVRDLTRHIQMVESATGSKASETVEAIFPGTIRLTQKFDGNEVTAFCDGLTGWVKAPWDTENLLPSWQRDAAQQELLRQLEYLLVSDRDSHKTIAYVKSVSGDRPGDVLDISAPAGGSVRVTIDSASGEVIAVEYKRIGPRGPQAAITDLYSDYRTTANGLRVPFKIRTVADGKPYMESVVTDVTYNRGLRPEVLGRKDPLGVE
jgi:hypothetical protein